MEEGFILLIFCSAWLVLCNSLRRADSEKGSNKGKENELPIPKLPPVYKNVKAHYVWEKETQKFKKKK